MILFRMSDEIVLTKIHPAGERESVEDESPATPISVDTFGGKIQDRVERV